MNIHISDFQLNFDLDDAPLWSCPKCFKQTLRIKPLDINYNFLVPSSEGEFFLDEFGEIPDPEGSFNAQVRCSEANCRRITYISGIAKLTPRFSEPNLFSSQEAEIIGSHTQVTPLFFYPPLDLIPIDSQKYEGVPSEIKEMLRSSSILFWVDQKACANRLRQVVEGLLDLGDVEEAPDLYTRIEKIINTDLARFKNNLQSVRIIGNNGSHRSYNLRQPKPLDTFQISEDDLVHAFNVIDVLLIFLFGNSMLQKKTTEIKERSLKKSKKALSHLHNE